MTIWTKLAGASILLGLVTMADAALAQVQVAVIGDSNVYGKGVSSSENYPTQLEAALKAKGLNVRIVNSGINGDTTTGVLSRLDSAAPQGTKVAVVWVGINDRRRGASDGEIRANRATIVSRLKARGIDVFVIAPPLYNPADHQNKALTVDDGHFNAAGYRRMVAKTLGPVQAMVAKAAKS